MSPEGRKWVVARFPSPDDRAWLHRVAELALRAAIEEDSEWITVAHLERADAAVRAAMFGDHEPIGWFGP